MTTLLREQRLTLPDAAQRAGVVPSTVWRWALHGCRGIFLDSVVIGVKRYTTVEALERFTAACTAEATSKKTKQAEAQLALFENHAAAQRTRHDPDAAAESGPTARSASGGRARG